MVWPPYRLRRCALPSCRAQSRLRRARRRTEKTIAPLVVMNRLTFAQLCVGGGVITGRSACAWLHIGSGLLLVSPCVWQGARARDIQWGGGWLVCARRSAQLTAPRLSDCVCVMARVELGPYGPQQRADMCAVACGAALVRAEPLTLTYERRRSGFSWELGDVGAAGAARAAWDGASASCASVVVRRCVGETIRGGAGLGGSKRKRL